MRQILHIFAKDSRRFWIEILISLAITVAFARVYPVYWQVSNFAVEGAEGTLRHQELQTLAGVLYSLLPVTWWVLVARVVLAESLVGDKQFWVTRPYVWWKLLSAKVVFLLVFVAVPFLISQWAIVTEAGFDARDYVGGLLWSVLAVLTVVVTPCMALATVMKNFGRMLLLVLGLMVALVVILCASAMMLFGIGTGNFAVAGSVAGSPGGGGWLWIAFVIACALAIVWQYARRRVWVARGLMTGFPLVALAVGIALPVRNDVDAVYAQGNAAAALHIAFTPSTNHSWSRSDFPREHKLGFNLPITVSGLGEGKAAIFDRMKLTIEAADGTRWSSPWDYAPGLRFLPGESPSQVSLMMPEDVYQRFARQSITLHVEFAVTMLHAGKVAHIALPAREYAVDGFGICSAGPYMPSGISNFQCRTAMHAPLLTYVTMKTTVGNSPTPCGPRQDTMGPTSQFTGGAWVGVLAPPVADFGLAPVQTEIVSLTYDGTKGEVPAFVCVGDPVTFTRYEVERRTRTELVLTNFRLPTTADPGSL